MSESHIIQFSEFWLFYVREHSHPLNRQLHFIGSSLGLVCLCVCLYTGNLLFIPLGLLLGYGFAWVGHFFFEHNKPATFKYPGLSYRGDYLMWWQILTGKIAW